MKLWGRGLVEVWTVMLGTPLGKLEAWAVLEELGVRTLLAVAVVGKGSTRAKRWRHNLLLSCAVVTPITSSMALTSQKRWSLRRQSWGLRTWRA